MLSELHALTTQSSTLHIYPNNSVTVPDDRSIPPVVKEGVTPVQVEIHSLTQAQLNQIDELHRSVTPPIRLDESGKPMLDENKEPLSNWDDPEFQKRKAKITAEARCLAIYYGCDAIRKDLLGENKDHTHLTNVLSQGLIETISAHIINAENLAYRPDFFSTASSAATQS